MDQFVMSASFLITNQTGKIEILFTVHFFSTTKSTCQQHDRKLPTLSMQLHVLRLHGATVQHQIHTIRVQGFNELSLTQHAARHFGLAQQPRPCKFTRRLRRISKNSHRGFSF